MRNITFSLFVFLLLPFSSVFSQVTLIPDPAFEQVLISLGYDTGVTDGSVPTANISSVTSLTVVGPGVSDLTGIEGFAALTYLDCSFNSISFLDLSQNTALVHLVCWANTLSTLDLSQNPMLEIVDCFGNQISNLNVSQNPRLTDLTCSNNQITSLDLTNDTSLIFLSCFGNSLSSLDISQNKALSEVYCDGNQLSVLDLSQNAVLSKLVCLSNLLTELYVGNNPLLTSLNCSSNPQLACLNIRNTNLTTLYTNNTALTCIEVDTVATAPDVALSTVNIGAASYSVDCGNSCSSVGIDENNLIDIKIFPNPAQNEIFLELNNNNGFEYSITTISGKFVQREYSRNNQISIGNLPNGYYILKIQQRGKIYTSPFVVARL